MLILFILYGKVSIAASGLADKIHPLSFQQTHGDGDATGVTGARPLT